MCKALFKCSLSYRNSGTNVHLQLAYELCFRNYMINSHMLELVIFFRLSSKFSIPAYSRKLKATFIIFLPLFILVATPYEVGETECVCEELEVSQ